MVLDLKLPDMTGFEILEELEQIRVADATCRLSCSLAAS